MRQNPPPKEWTARHIEVMPKKPVMRPFFQGVVVGFLFGVIVGMGALVWVLP